MEVSRSARPEEIVLPERFEMSQDWRVGLGDEIEAPFVLDFNDDAR